MIELASPKWWANLITYLVFPLGLGYIGMDRFYRGQILWGIIKLITAGGLLVWYLIDLVIYSYRFGKTGQWEKP